MALPVITQEELDSKVTETSKLARIFFESSNPFSDERLASLIHQMEGGLELQGCTTFQGPFVIESIEPDKDVMVIIGE